MKIDFIRRVLLPHFPLTRCCDVLGVSRSGCYAARTRTPSSRTLRRERLADAVRTVHQQTRGVYGSPRIARELNRRGTAVCRNTAASIMREHGLRSRRCKRFRPRTTDSSRILVPAPNLLRHAPPPDAPNRVWVADITYIPLAGGFIYLAAVMDLFSRHIVGWALDDSLDGSLTQRALRAAVVSHAPAAGLVHHSDRGIQYDCRAYRAMLTHHKMLQSMSRRGDCYDNAAMDSFFATLKAELVRDTAFTDMDHARQEIFRYIEGFYNTRRLHSAIGYRTPAEAHTPTG